MLFQITVQASLFSVLYMQNYIINFKNERMGRWNIEKMWEGLTADVFIQSFSHCCVIRSSFAKVGTVRLSFHALSVKYFVLTAHNISRWKTIIPNRSLDCLYADKFSSCHLFHRFSVTMEPHCVFKASKHLLKNRSCRHQNANDWFGIIVNQRSMFWEVLYADAGWHWMNVSTRICI